MINLNTSTANDLGADVGAWEYVIEILPPSSSSSKSVLLGSRDHGFKESVTGGWDYIRILDADLRVSGLTESIDLDGGKIPTTSASVSIKNIQYDTEDGDTFGVEKKSLSQVIGSSIGRKVIIYVKSSSVEKFDDMTIVAELRIRKISHSKNKINFVLEDFFDNLQNRLIPNYKKLKKGETFEYYEEKYAPILYGHLEQAPCVVSYVSDSVNDMGVITGNKVRIVPDESYYDSTLSSIEGIRGYAHFNTYSHLEDDNRVMIKLADKIASVPRYRYKTSSQEVEDVWKNSRQYESYENYIKLYNDSDLDFLKNGAIWCSFTNYAISEEKYSAGNVVVNFPMPDGHHDIEGNWVWFEKIEDGEVGHMSSWRDNYSDEGTTNDWSGSGFGVNGFPWNAWNTSDHDVSRVWSYYSLQMQYEFEPLSGMSIFERTHPETNAKDPVPYSLDLLGYFQCNIEYTMDVSPPNPERFIIAYNF